MGERSYPPPLRRSASLPPMLTPQTDPESARRLHALTELLHTELAYLLDLRTLVSVYLRLLPLLKSRSSLAHTSLSNPPIAYFSRPPPAQSNLTTHRTLTHPYLHPSTSFPVDTPSSIPPRTEKYTSRHLFSASDLDTITRNAEDILHFHETLVLRLRQVVSQFGLSMSAKSDSNALAYSVAPIDVHSAVNAVATVFVDHASSFEQYQPFCSGHSEAFDLVRKVQHRYPAEWEAFEVRCAGMAAQIHLQDPFEDDLEPRSDSKRYALDLCRRRHSLSSLGVIPVSNLKAPTFSASECGHGDQDTSTRRPRLMFMDYMIKPVQRVCRYPLLFDQLQVRTKHTLTDDSHLAASQDTVRNTLRTMRTVARLVDEARRKQDVSAKSVQIVSRITQGLLASAAGHNQPPQAVALSAFLSTLGSCYLSGSLDVIHYRGMNMARLGTVKAKYLGAFLFPGGFLVLVKVSKSKAYEPKYWFNLRAFELVDSNLDDVLLPSWFRLSSKAHMFEFAASCRREKDIWVDAIRRAIAEEVSWSDEPPSSLRTDFTAPPPEDMPFETISPLPTIQSIPELNGAELVVPSSGEIPPLATQRTAQIHLHTEKPAKYDTVASSRRSLVGPLPAPAPESNMFHLVRSTASAREQVDRGLLDVFSEKCLTARFHAYTHAEDLFEAQRVTRSFSRSASALTMASAMSVAAKNKLTKRESVLVPRKKSSVEGNGALGDTENRMNSMLSVAPNPVRRRQHPSHLKIVAITKTASQQGDDDGNEPSLESPSPLSHCSSVSFVTPATPLTVHAPLPAPSGEFDGFQSRSESLNVHLKDCAPKRSRSMIENVRVFFAPRTASPTAALSRAPSARSSVSNSGLLRWWSRESLRRRVRSAPDVPSEELPSAITTMSLHVEAAPRSLVATAERPYSQPDLHCLYSDSAGLPTTEFGGHYSSQTKSVFFSRGPRRRHTPGRHGQDSTQVPARIRRNFSFLQRFTHATSTRDFDDTAMLS